MISRLASPAEASDYVRSAVSSRDLLALTQELVRIPTENPPGVTAAACARVAAYLEPAGFSLEYVEPSPGVVSIIARYRFSTPGRTLLLNGHLDVVPAGSTGWTRDPWSGDFDGTRVHGRGSLDMKGPLAGLIVAATTVTSSQLPLAGELILTVVADEEQGGCLGTGALIESARLQADGALIGEPGDGALAIAHRGFCFVKLSTEGVAGHASAPADAVNAVEAMVDVLCACRTIRLSHAPHPLLGGPTIAIGTTISGGTRPNVVPDRCEATLDIRTVPGMTPARIIEEIRAHLATVPTACSGVTVELVSHSHPAETPAEAVIVGSAASAFQREFGRIPELVGFPATTDAQWLVNVGGIPTIAAIGPGRITECHVSNESVDLIELTRYARVYADTIVTFLGTSMNQPITSSG